MICTKTRLMTKLQTQFQLFTLLFAASFFLATVVLWTREFSVGALQQSDPVYIGPLFSWNSGRCRSFYNSSNSQGIAVRRASITPLQVSEDQFEMGRQQAMMPNHVANEVFISDKYKFIYIEVRKCASSTVRRLLGKHFGASWNCPQHASSSVDARLVASIRRSSTIISFFHL